MNYCKDCNYFEFVANLQGMCHRFPPTAAIVMMPQQHPISRQVTTSPQSMATLPTVAEESWCGEFVQAPPKLALA